MSTRVAVKCAAQPSTRRRRRSRKELFSVADSPPTPVDEGGGEGAARVTTGTKASPRLWRLLGQAQEEMELGADILGDELTSLWQTLREDAAVPTVARDHGIHSEFSGDSTKQEEAATVNGEDGGDASNGIRAHRCESLARSSAHKARLPADQTDALLAGLAQLQAEIEAEASSFQQRKSEIVQGLEALRGRRGGELGKVAKLEDEAESMRAAIVASRARLLDRVRELQRLSGRSLRLPRAVSASAATTASYNAAATNGAEGATAPGRDPGRLPAAHLSEISGHSLDDLVDSAHAVVAARQELAELQDAVEAGRAELARQNNRTRAAREQTSRFEALRSSAASVAEKAGRQASQARADAEAATRARRSAGDDLVKAQAARDTAEQEAEHERRRLETLRREAAEVEAGLRAAAESKRVEEARAEAAALAASHEEARLADCRDSFGLEVEGLQKGVGELEAEAVGWRAALDEARARLAGEEERGRADKTRMEAESARLAEASKKMKEDTREWVDRIESLRRQHAAESEKLQHEARQAMTDLEALRSKCLVTRSELREAQGQLRVVCEVVERRAAGREEVEVAAVSLGRRVAELEAHVADLDAEKSRMVACNDATLHRLEEENAHWTNAVAERRKEYETLTKLLTEKAESVGELDRQAEQYAIKVRHARAEQEAAEARAAEALCAAREAAGLAERGKGRAERDEARAEAAKRRAAEATEKVQQAVAETDSLSSSLEHVKGDLQIARQAVAEAEDERADARQQLAALAEKRRAEERAVEATRQRATVLAQEEAGLRASAMAARRESVKESEAATVSKGELTELREAADKERRGLAAIRDQMLELEAELARKREGARFLKNAADGQRACLDELKREVILVRDERLNVEKEVWSQKSELDGLSARRDDALRRERQREREESTLASRREALTTAVTQEEKRLSQAKVARQEVEAEVEGLKASASSIAAEIHGAHQIVAARREDAAATLRRAEEDRRRVTDMATEATQLSSKISALRVTKGALDAELAGLRHELDALRTSVRGARHVRSDVQNSLQEATVPREKAELLGTFGRPTARRLRRATLGRAEGLAGFDHGSRRGGDGAADAGQRRENDSRLDSDERDGGGALVDIVADFQGRLRRQVQAALAEGEGHGGQHVHRIERAR